MRCSLAGPSCVLNCVLCQREVSARLADLYASLSNEFLFELAARLAQVKVIWSFCVHVCAATDVTVCFCSVTATKKWRACC